MVLGMASARRYVQPMTTPALLTADDLMRLQPLHKRTELVRGRMIVREPAGFRHGDVAMSIALALGQFLRTNPIGRLVAAETGFVLFRNPDTVRAPDVAFVRQDRIPNPMPRGYAPFAPDLAVEVLSPDDRPGEVLAKVADWLKAGTQLVWVVNPDRRLARVYRADGTELEISETGALDGENVLPGFECVLGEVLG
jgi:Uma2 family endonuclease